MAEETKDKPAQKGPKMVKVKATRHVQIHPEKGGEPIYIKAGDTAMVPEADVERHGALLQVVD